MTEEHLESIRELENERAANHLFAIKTIASYKANGEGLDKQLGEMLLNNFDQWSIVNGYKAFDIWDYKGPQNAQQIDVSLRRTPELSHAENRDLVRHLVSINNIIAKKCDRCPSMGCMGCWFSGREDFNVGSALVLIHLLDHKSISDVMGLNGYDESWDFVKYFPGNAAKYHPIMNDRCEVPYLDNSIF